MSNKEWSRVYYQKNRGTILEGQKKRREENLELFREKSRRCYQNTRGKRLKYGREQRKRIKVEILTYYSNGELACVQCGESRLAALSIDHLNNNGAEEKRRLGGAGLTTYYWLRRNNFPEGYQTLCMNCQFVKKEQVFLAGLCEEGG